MTDTINQLRKLAGITEQAAHGAINIPLSADEYDAIAEQVVDAAISILGSANKLDPSWSRAFPQLIAAYLKNKLVNGDLVLDMWNEGAFDQLVRR